MKIEKICSSYEINIAFHLSRCSNQNVCFFVLSVKYIFSIGIMLDVFRIVPIVKFKTECTIVVNMHAFCLNL